MFYKYLMTSSKDLRGTLKLIVRTHTNTEVAYVSSENPDDDMVRLVDAEITLVKNKTDNRWLSQRDELKCELDTYSDEIRALVLDMGVNTIYYEYNQVESKLLGWESRGSNPNTVPDELLSWMETTEETLEWVINDVKSAIFKYKTFVSEVRRIRLLGKKSITNCPPDKIESEYKSILYSLDLLSAYAMN